MADKIEVILEKCLARLKAGDTMEDCLRRFPDRRAELEPLLSAAAKMYSVPEISVSEDFRRESHDRLLAGIRNEAKPVATRRFRLQKLNFRVIVPAAMVVLLALLFWLVSPGLTPASMPAQINPDKFSLSVLSGEVETLAANSTSWQAVNGTIELATGSAVRTSDGGHAVITFFDGSTAALDPGTEVTVAESSFVNEQSVHIVLNQLSGETWNNVIGTGTQQPYYAVQTPLATLVAQGTSFSSEVDTSGATGLSVIKGTVTVIDKQNNEVSVAQDQQLNIQNTLAAAVPENIPAAKNELSLSLNPSGVCSVSDPDGASTGYLTNGISFNQIPNSSAALSTNGQSIQIETPVSGVYTITVRAIIPEDMVLAIQLVQNNQTVYQQNLTLTATTGSDWTVHVDLSNQANVTQSADIVSFAPVAGKTPATVVQMPLAIQRATPVAAVATTPNTGSAAAGITKTTTSTNTAPAVSAATTTTKPSSAAAVPPTAVPPITATTGTTTTKQPIVTVPPVAVTPSTTTTTTTPITTAPSAVTPPTVKTTTATTTTKSTSSAPNSVK
ncbi:MAG: FecR domain-containing protein [Dehalococcoidales bacterium]|jgi:hypothetical protein